MTNDDRSKKPQSEAAARRAAEAPELAGSQSPEGQVSVEQTGFDASESIEPQELRDLRTDLEEMKDRALRSQAELENYRKRVARQMDDERRYAELYVLRDLLPLRDNIQRAIEAAVNANESPTLLQGFQLVAKQLDDLLVKHHCDRIDALHQPFDPHLHEAISQLPSAEFPPHTVLHVTQEGFVLYDRVVRPSQVVVSAAAPEPSPGDDGQGA